jgi:hypothetical protein
MLKKYSLYSTNHPNDEIEVSKIIVGSIYYLRIL